MSYILFYSSMDTKQFTSKLISIINNSPLNNYVYKQCIDIDPRTGQRPQILYQYGIRRVPCMVVENNQVLMERSLLYWIQNKCNQLTTMPVGQTRENFNNIRQQNGNTMQQPQNGQPVGVNLSSGGDPFNKSGLTNNTVNVSTGRPLIMNVDPNTPPELLKSNNAINLKTTITGPLPPSMSTSVRDPQNMNNGERPLPDWLKPIDTKGDSLKQKQAQNAYYEELCRSRGIKA